MSATRRAAVQSAIAVNPFLSNRERQVMIRLAQEAIERFQSGVRTWRVTMTRLRFRCGRAGLTVGTAHPCLLGHQEGHDIDTYANEFCFAVAALNGLVPQYVQAA